MTVTIECRMNIEEFTGVKGPVASFLNPDRVGVLVQSLTYELWVATYFQVKSVCNFLPICPKW